MNANLEYEILKPPHWLMAVTFGGEVILNASSQISELRARVCLLEIMGRMEGEGVAEY